MFEFFFGELAVVKVAAHFNVEFATQRCNVDVDLLVVVRFILSKLCREVLRENLRLSDVGVTKNHTELSVSTTVGRSGF